MATSVLGKRSRAMARLSEPTGITTRAKRRADSKPSTSIDIHEDESNKSRAMLGERMDVDGAPSTNENDTPTNVASPVEPVALVETTSALKHQPYTPSKSRHYDALAENTTPRHVKSQPLTPPSRRNPGTPQSSGRNIYQEARKIFTRGCSTTSTLIGRDSEREELNKFLADRLGFSRNGCLYVSGPPGTGKSAFVTEVCKSMVKDSTVKYAYANCMSIKNATDVYLDLLTQLDADINVMAEDPRRALLKTFSDANGTGSYLVVLDEIDQLLHLDLAVLYSLFEMSFTRNSRLVLVGIANALDLTDRFLPRLKARNLKPDLLPFLPYTAPQIASIVSARCRSLLPSTSASNPNFTPLLMPPAITLISKKVASQTGDLRKAFDIVQRVVDVVEAETREKLSQEASMPTPQASPSRAPLGENPNLSSPAKNNGKMPASQRLADLSAETAPRATLAHVVRVTSAAFGNGTSQRLKGLNLQQKAVLCSLFALEQKKRIELSELPQTPSKTGRGSLCATPSSKSALTFTAPTMRMLFEAYSSLCKRDNVLHPLSNTEFRDVVGNLETLSLVTSVEGRSGSFQATPSKRGRSVAFAGAVKADDKRMSACVGVQELEAAVEGVGSGILKKILSSYEIL